MSPVCSPNLAWQTVALLGRNLELPSILPYIEQQQEREKKEPDPVKKNKHI
jgi:hypothetical protein